MIERAKSKICEVKDFPKPGIGFKDITPLIEDAECFAHVVDELVSWARKRKPEVVVGLESRGFFFSGPVAYNLGVGMAVIRKKGKLPRKTISIKAPNEYAVEYFEMHHDSIKSGQRVLIVDDLIATGSTSVSAIDLVKKLGGKVVGFAAVVDLAFLKGLDFIKKAHPDIDVLSLISFEK
ncbi:MAG: adenine phosphoribosyltransferase [Candidatus Aminicenantes bacterium]|nr:adenine phosphoribosyltransferase [Candidatus Aminicenantes bacterium]